MSKRDGFFLIENSLIDSGLLSEIGPHGAAVYLVLLRHAGTRESCWPSVRTISKLSGVGLHSVNKSLKSLEHLGLLKKEKRRRFNSNKYVVSVAPGATVTVPSVAPGATECCAPRISSVAPGAFSKGRRRNEEDVMKNSSRQRSKFTDGDRATASFMWELIQDLLPNAKRPNLDKWADTVRLMRERDGRMDLEIREVFSWANADTFWQSNILSPAKLRKQWDQLELKRRNGSGKRKVARPLTREEEKDFKLEDMLG